MFIVFLSFIPWWANLLLMLFSALMYYYSDGNGGNWFAQNLGQFNIQFGLGDGGGFRQWAPWGNQFGPTAPTEDEVRNKMGALPTELFEPKEVLSEKSVKELRALLKRRQVNTENVLEKDELLSLFETSGSWTASCTICLDDYEHGDVLRILPCRHFFHIQCIDKWAVESTARVRTCPMCNKPLFTESENLGRM
eukprot:m.340003 g.340003  ORF g.340003 m.340003 type:complete len:194 (-) comp19076_c0_seq1:245-826(-)